MLAWREERLELHELCDEVGRKIRRAVRAGDLREQVRQHCERAWVLMRLRDGWPAGTWGWGHWQALMWFDVLQANAIADRLARLS